MSVNPCIDETASGTLGLLRRRSHQIAFISALFCCGTTSASGLFMVPMMTGRLYITAYACWSSYPLCVQTSTSVIKCVFLLNAKQCMRVIYRRSENSSTIIGAHSYVYDALRYGYGVYVVHVSRLDAQFIMLLRRYWTSSWTYKDVMRCSLLDIIVAWHVITLYCVSSVALWWHRVVATIGAWRFIRGYQAQHRLLCSRYRCLYARQARSEYLKWTG